MAEVWAVASAAITVGGGIISGIAAEKKSKQDRKNANADRTAATKESTQYGAATSLFESQLEDYFNQLSRERKQRGLSQFRQFSTLGNFAPQYQNTETPIIAGQSPNINTALAEQVPLDNGKK